MVEVPSAALTADRLTAEADFFSIGTNDLIALTLAADRTDEPAGRLYEPLHPAVLRLLRFVRRAAARKGRASSVCGEMASDPALLAAAARTRPHRVQHGAGGDPARASPDRPRGGRRRRAARRAKSSRCHREEGRALLQTAVEKAEQSSGAVAK